MITVVGLGPAGLDRVPVGNLAVLEDPAATVFVRTLRHPAATELARRRRVQSCDDLYESSDDFDEVYHQIVERLVAQPGPVVYGVPGSPSMGERSVELLRARAEIEILGAESFLDLVFESTGIDPLAAGVRVMDARDLPFPLLIDGPLVVGQVDHPLVAGDLKVRLLDQLPPETGVWILADLGGDDERVKQISLVDLDQIEVGVRTTVALTPEPAGWPGLVRVVDRLRLDCPWDRVQTHQSLIRYLVEEAYEVIEAIGRLPVDATQPLDPVDYVELEDELGDLMLQVLLHATIASESAGFTIDDVAEQQRAKLVRRHPHVFGDAEAADPSEVEALWAARKAKESPAESHMDGIPSMPPLARADKIQRRAAKAGFDWPGPDPVYGKIEEELAEVRAAPASARSAEIGDLLFAVVNLARHLGVDPDLALSQAVDKFVRRFRTMEAAGPLDGLTLAELDERWDAAKERE